MEIYEYALRIQSKGLKILKNASLSFLSVDLLIYKITAAVGAAVLRAAVADDIAEGHGDVDPKDLSHMPKVSSK